LIAHGVAVGEGDLDMLKMFTETNPSHLNDVNEKGEVSVSAFILCDVFYCVCSIGQEIDSLLLSFGHRTDSI
jgi:hypothetical protein